MTHGKKSKTIYTDLKYNRYISDINIDYIKNYL